MGSCTHCGVYFRNEENLHLHIAAHEFAMSSGKGMKCSICGFHFLNTDDYDGHVGTELHREAVKNRRKKNQVKCIDAK